MEFSIFSTQKKIKMEKGNINIQAENIFPNYQEIFIHRSRNFFKRINF